jgi:hypothetical protein
MASEEIVIQQLEDLHHRLQRDPARDQRAGLRAGGQAQQTQDVKPSFLLTLLPSKSFNSFQELDVFNLLM